MREGLFDLRIGRHVSALLANGLGGGSLINAGVLVEPDADVFKKNWPQDFAHGIPKKDFDTVRAMLGAKCVPGAGPSKLEALRLVASRIRGAIPDSAPIAVSFDGSATVPGVEQQACTQCGDCFSGCNCGAKNTLAMNYLPLAYQRGARIVCGATVLTVQPCDDFWEIRWRFTDEQLAKRFGPLPPPLIAARVILAAGTYGSTGILLRSHDAGFKELSRERLGMRFSTNGDMIAAGTGMPVPVRASGSESVAPQNRSIGPTITGYIDRRRGGNGAAAGETPKPFMIEELAIPAMLRRPLEETVKLSQTLNDLAVTDWTTHGGEAVDPAAIDPHAIDSLAVYRQASTGCSPTVLWARRS
jgi:choline dehydrogenase-like flavoprotein